VKHCKTL